MKYLILTLLIGLSVSCKKYSKTRYEFDVVFNKPAKNALLKSHGTTGCNPINNNLSGSCYFEAVDPDELMFTAEVLDNEATCYLKVWENQELIFDGNVPITNENEGYTKFSKTIKL
jgi:hypothetical protein